MKKFLILTVLSLFIISCSSTNNTANQDTDEISDNNFRRISERVVVVKSTDEETILATGRYGNWYRVNTRLTERMYYDVNLDISRSKPENFITNARLIDFTPGEFLQKDLMAKYDMAYNQIRTGTK